MQDNDFGMFFMDGRDFCSVCCFIFFGKKTCQWCLIYMQQMLHVRPLF